MRRAFALLLLLAAFEAAQAAQIKVFLGPTISSYTGRWPSDVFPGAMGRRTGLNPLLNSRTGTLEGFGIEFAIGKRFSLELDGLYYTMGSTFTQPTMIFTVQREIYSLESLNAPLLIKFRPRQGLFPYLLASVDLGFVLDHTRTSLILPEAGVIYSAGRCTTHAIEVSSSNGTAADRARVNMAVLLPARVVHHECQPGSDTPRIRSTASPAAARGRGARAGAARRVDAPAALAGASAPAGLPGRG